ncbi:MAG: tRNA(Met) cytidine acetyltransferase [Cardiobacteriaceae bacterium]|nr:tRNA(Met) cytidine acetyltransferase [Cardiobacteriaceae bacterium]
MRKLILIEKNDLPKKEVFGRDFKLENYRKILGINYSQDIYYSAEQGLNPNALLAIAGTLIDGKNFHLYLPKSYPQGDPDLLKKLDYLIDFQLCNNFFNQRLENIIQQENFIRAETKSSIQEINIKTEQSQCLIGCRGAGKSTLLAEKAKYLLDKNIYPLLIVASFNKNLANFRLQLENSQLSKLFFLPPDEAIRRNLNAKYMLIDEAAAIAPLQLLELIRKYPNYSLATSLEGYEGSANYFLIKTLPQISKNAEVIYLSESYRFSNEDHLASCLNAIFCRNYHYKIDTNTSIEEINFRPVNQKELFENEYLLGQIVALLSKAHYRNRPEDVKFLLDIPLQILVVAENKLGQIIGICQTKIETPLPEELISAVISGLSRPRGRILMQQLLFNTKNPAWGKIQIARVCRIAVAEEFRRQKIGANLIKKTREILPDNCQLGVIYSFNEEVQSFWLGNNFRQIWKSNQARSRNLGESCVLLQN